MREIKRGESVMKSKPSSETPWLTADTRKFVKALEKQGGPPLYKLAIPDARQVLLDAQSGKIKALKKGTCTIYIFANNGVYKSVKVTVKK